MLILVIFYQTKKLYKENYENILIDSISYKTSVGAKPLRIMFNEIMDGSVTWMDGWLDLIGLIGYNRWIY